MSVLDNSKELIISTKAFTHLIKNVPSVIPNVSLHKRDLTKSGLERHFRK